MTTLADLRADLFPAGRPAGATGPGSRARSIAWVRVMKARVPAFDALDPDDLAVVPLSALAVVAPTEAEVDAVVSALAAAPVSGVLLLDPETGASGLPDPSIDVLDRGLSDAGIAALRLARGDPSTIERSVIGFILGREAELERQASILESDLERRALAGDDVASLIAATAAFLGRAVALEDQRGTTLAVHAPADAPDAGPGVAAYAAAPSTAVALRTDLPRGSGSGGRIALLGWRPASDLERAVAGRAAGLIALELAREDAVRRAGDRAGRAEVLPAAGPPWRVLLGPQRAGDARGEVGSARAAREQLRRELRLLAPARLLALRGDADSLEVRLIIAGVPAAADLPAAVARRLGATVGLSRPFDAAGDRPAAEAEARATLDAAVSLPEPPRVARAESLAAYRLLGAVHNLPDGRRLARAMLDPLLHGRADVQREHLATLEAVLEHGGVNEAASSLGVHRNTVAYRLRRIETLAGWNVADPELRLPLLVAIRIVQND